MAVALSHTCDELRWMSSVGGIIDDVKQAIGLRHQLINRAFVVKIMESSERNLFFFLKTQQMIV